MSEKCEDTRRIKTEIERAIEAFRSGSPVLIHDFDDREGETDLIYPAEAITPDAVARLRNDAGGLVCVALCDAAARAFSIPYLKDVLDHPTTEDPDLAYDSRSSFSLTVNHRDTFTGITDQDRALTITALANAARAINQGTDYDIENFAAEFRSPGHVNLLRAAPDLLADRQGHTELSITLATAADVAPAAVVCEMLDDTTGEALQAAAAREYAEERGYAFLKGKWFIEHFADGEA